MILTSQQVKEMLHIGDTRLANLVKEGKLVPVNKPKDGAKKYFRKFDHTAVNKLRTEMKQNGELGLSVGTARRTNGQNNNPQGITSLLREIKNQLDRIEKLWS